MTSGKSTFQRNLIASILLIWFLELNVAGAPPFRRWEFKEPHMGTLFRLTLFAENFKAASNAAKKAFKRIHEIESSLTDYQDNSELNQLCRNAYESPQVVSQDLFNVLQESHHLSEVSGGAFDVTIKPLINLWKDHARRNNLPTPHQLNQARKMVDYRQISYNPTIRSVRLTRKNISIDLGGIGKGYAADAALDVLKDNGILSVIIDAGGDLRLGDPPPGQKLWAVSVSPRAERILPMRLHLSNCGIATSSDGLNFFKINNKRYSHIINPSTGLSVEHSQLVTVIASKASIADALATALNVMGPGPGIRLAEKLNNVEACFFEATKQTLVVVRKTSGFDAITPSTQ